MRTEIDRNDARNMWETGCGRVNREAEALTPDHTFLVHEIVDDLDTIPQLELRLLGHGQHRPEELAGFHFRQVGNPVGAALF